MFFFTGCHHPSDARFFERAFISVNALRRRRWMAATDWILDSGAFTEISRFGDYRESVDDYARQIDRWTTSSTGRLLCAVAQDFMCEAPILAKWGRTVRQHQERTIARYDALLAARPSVHVMPVLQGQTPEDYARHLDMYGSRIAPDHWIGVGSVCKRNGDPRAVEDVIGAIHDAGPKLKLHGFGLKTTAIRRADIRCYLATADSLAWSYHARKQRRTQNDPNEAIAWAARFGYDTSGMNRETWRTIVPGAVWGEGTHPERASDG